MLNKTVAKLFRTMNASQQITWNAFYLGMVAASHIDNSRLARNTLIERCSAVSRLVSSVEMKPSFENSLSDGREVAMTEMYFLATLNKFGYRGFMASQLLKGSAVIGSSSRVTKARTSALARAGISSVDTAWLVVRTSSAWCAHSPPVRAWLETGSCSWTAEEPAGNSTGTFTT